MPESKLNAVLYTETALRNAVSIKQYLQQRFSEKEINNFFALLQSFEMVTLSFPELYPTTSKKKNVRRAVLSKELSVFYRIMKSEIEVLAIFDNRCDLKEWV